ncbi:MAG: hypothetical protein JOZ17_08665, partial [Acetobacteraceae bacterium]|nr:hypothetical protein [Acetobacteraceae bacterium]
GHHRTNTGEASTELRITLTDRGRQRVLQDVVLDDGGTVTGYFHYDAATGTYLDADVTATSGPNGTGNWGIKPASFPWSYPVHGGITGDPLKAGGSTPSKLVLLNSYQDPDNVERREFVYLRLMFSQPLTNAAGTVPLVIDPAAPVSATCTVDPSGRNPTLGALV